ncbi:MAG: DUF3857 and transglutaminase domain-containing protein [Chitinophagaceae bacterium]|nr:DUF3857 and transglutaminase domain-containing protein [Chitinophagaceae bacterium]
MRKTFSLAILFLLSLTLFAQKAKDIPAFGKVEKTDLEMKECDFDKKAEALVLFDVAELSCTFVGEEAYIELDRHIRIKILRDKGLDQANIHIRYLTTQRQNIRNLTAQTFNLDAAGNIVVSKLEKKLVYEKKINKHWSEEVFTFPEVKPGSVIEYKYSMTGAGLEEWYFQRSIPVRLSRYTIDFPTEFDIYCQPVSSLRVETSKETRNQSYINKYTMRNIPALRDEPYISCENDYLQRLEPRLIAINTPLRRINLVPSWPQVIKNLMEDEDFGVQLKKEIPRTADLDEQLKKIAHPFEKMTTIYNYVRKNMEWDGISSIWAMNGVKAAWKDKKGTDGEINLILVNLLKDAGLIAHPILLSSRENGRIMSNIPGISQFDKVMAQVKINNKTYILDGTEKYTPSTLIPEKVMFSEGLVIEKLDTYQWGWTELWDDKQLHKNVTVLSASISADGKMSGEASIYSYDYARLSRVSAIKKDKEKYIEEYFTSKNQGLTIDSILIENEDQDSVPLLHKIIFNQPVTASGEYQYFSLNMFSGLEQNPFVADTRFSDVFFGTNQQYSIIGTFIIPEGYSFETLPKNLRMIMPDTSISITRQMAARENTLSVRINLDFKRPFYSVGEYAEFREFYKQLFALLSEQIVFRKKA